MRYLVLLLLVCLFEGEPSLGDYVDFEDLISEALNVIAEKKGDTVTSFTTEKLKVSVPDAIEYGEAEEERSDVIETVSHFLENPSSEADQVQFDEEYEYEDDFTWVVENGLQMKEVPDMNVTEEMQGFSTQAIISRDTSDEELEDQEKSVTKTLRKNATINLPPKSSVNATWDIVEKEVHIPWTMDIEIRGNVQVKYKVKTRTISIDKIAKEGEFPDDLFEIKSGYIVFHANGYLKAEAAYSDILTYDDIKTETPPADEEEITLDVEEEEPTANDLAAAEDDIALAVVKGVVSSLNENTDDDSKLKPWLKVAGGIANVYSGEANDPEQWKEIADGALGILSQAKNSTLGKKAMGGLKNLRNRIRDSSRSKSKKIQAPAPSPAGGKCKSKRCKPRRNRNRKTRTRKVPSKGKPSGTSSSPRKPGRPKPNTSGKPGRPSKPGRPGKPRKPARKPTKKTKNTRVKKPKTKRKPKVRGRKPSRTGKTKNTKNKKSRG